MDVFISKEPVARYDEARKEVNEERLRRAYATSFGQAKTLNATDARLIDALGSKTILPDVEIDGLSRGIKTANNRPVTK